MLMDSSSLSKIASPHQENPNSLSWEKITAKQQQSTTEASHALLGTNHTGSKRFKSLMKIKRLNFFTTAV